jgi:hypothetical protein
MLSLKAFIRFFIIVVGLLLIFTAGRKLASPLTPHALAAPQLPNYAKILNKY